jgi:GNAT superfamily N-acetyltransferase
MDYYLASPADLPQLAEMRWDFRLEDDSSPTVEQGQFVAACRAFLAAGLHNGKWVYWVAADGELLAAHIFVQMIKPVPRPNHLDDTYGYVTNVYARPAYRNQGVGSALIARVKEWAVAKDLAIMFLWPSERSVPFYRRAGFAPSQDLLELHLREDLYVGQSHTPCSRQRCLLQP